MGEVFSYPKEVTLHAFQSDTGRLGDTLREAAEWLDTVEDEDQIHKVEVELGFEGRFPYVIVYVIKLKDMAFTKPGKGDR
jgi:hypothetical protein